MSEKQAVWWTDPMETRPPILSIAASKQGRYVDPVYLVRLDPDGPKPGETWGWADMRRVEIIRPSKIEESGVTSWWVRSASGTAFGVYTRDLSPIKPTRTVTVELTEKEIESVQRSHVNRLHGSLGSLYAKLAEALEDS